MTKHIDLINTFAKGAEEVKKREKKKGLNAVIYTRVSSKEQLDNLSLETQLKGCDEFAKKNGYEVCERFGGTYESAMSDERKQFVNMINYVKRAKQKISYIIVYSIERFSRTGDNAIWLSRQLRALGVTIVSVTQPIDTSNPSGVMQQNILFLFSQYDNDLRRSKTIAGMKEKLLKGEWMGMLPMGYSFDRTHKTKEQRVIFNKDATLIKKAFLMKLNGTTNIEIAEKITSMGLTLTYKRLTETLRNPFYCGYVAHNLLEGQTVKGKHPALITEEMFLQVNQLLSRSGFEHKEENENLPMKKFMRCADCDTPLTGYLRVKKFVNGTTRDYHYYKCYTRGCQCNRSNVLMHKKFVDLLEQVQLDPRLIPLVKRQLEITWENMNESVGNERKVMIAKQCELKEKQEKIDDRFAVGEIDRLLYEKTTGKIKDELKGINQELDKTDFGISNSKELIEKGVVFASELASCWVDGDYEERKMVQEILFPDGIVFDKKTDTFRTHNINAVIAVINEISHNYYQKKERQTNENIDLSPSVARGGVEPPTFGL
jgi:site-specific DNA recombinase